MRLPITLLSSLSLLSACGHYGERFEEELSGEVALPPGTKSVSIRLPSGPLTVHQGPAGVVRYQILALRAADTAEQLERLRAIELRPRLEAGADGAVSLAIGELPADADPRQHRLVCKAVLEVPADVAFVGSTTVGPVAAIGLAGPVNLSTGHGHAHLDACSAHSVLRVGTGDVVINAHRGGLDVEAGAKAKGDKPHLMQVWVDALDAAGLKLINRRGSIQAHVPRDSVFVLDAQAEVPTLKVTDKVRNSFGIPLQGFGEHGARMRGAVGDNGPPIVMEAHAGRISLTARD